MFQGNWKLCRERLEKCTYHIFYFLASKNKICCTEVILRTSYLKKMLFLLNIINVKNVLYGDRILYYERFVIDKI